MEDERASGGPRGSERRTVTRERGCGSSKATLAWQTSPALQRCEQQQSEEQDCERRLLAANCRTHGWRADRAAFLPIHLPFQFNPLSVSILPEGDAEGKATDEDRHQRYGRKGRI